MSLKYMHTHTHIHAHTPTHPHTHIHTHIHTHTHTCTNRYALRLRYVRRDQQKNTGFKNYIKRDHQKIFDVQRSRRDKHIEINQH